MILFLRKANDRIVSGANAVLGSSLFLWFCVALIVVPAWHPGALQIAQYLSSGVIQLIALPLLAISAKKGHDRHGAQEKALRELHDKHDALARHLKSKGAGK